MPAQEKDINTTSPDNRALFIQEGTLLKDMPVNLSNASSSGSQEGKTKAPLNNNSALDSDPDLITTLVEEYSNEEKPSDGEIYRKIRQYERDGNVYFQKRWKSRLSNHGRRNLRQLFDHGDGELVAAFDSLLDIPGLWDGMRLSTLHKVMGIKCDEVGEVTKTASFC